MRFALVTTNLRGGGAERAMINLASLLKAHGHEAQLILLEHRIDHALPADLAVTALTAPGETAHKGFFGKRWLALRLNRLIRRLGGPQGFDLILSTLPFADAVCRLAHLPRLWHRIANTLSAEIDLLGRDFPTKAAFRLKRYRKLYCHGRLVAVSEGVAADLRQLGIVAERIECLHNPFDPHALQVRAREALDVPKGPYIVHVGRFSPQKRHDLLFQAFAQIRSEHRLALLCHDAPELRAMIASFGLADRVIVAGFQPNPYPWIAHADALVLCSEHEGMPNVLIEALLLGTPVVSTDCPSGPREVLQGGRLGRLVPRGDASALAEALGATLAAPRRTPPFDPAPHLPTAVVDRLQQLAAETH